MPQRKRIEVTDELRAKVAKLHADGISRNGIARELGIGPATVTRITQAAGLAFDTSNSRKATQAKINKADRGRAEAISRFYEQAHVALDRLNRPRAWKTIMRGSMGAEYAERLGFIPARDLREIMDAASKAAFCAAKLEQLDAGASITKVKGLLIATAEVFGLDDEGDAAAEK